MDNNRGGQDRLAPGIAATALAGIDGDVPRIAESELG